MPHNPLALKIYRSDPLAVLLLDRLSATPLAVAVFIAVVPLAIYAGVCSGAGCLQAGPRWTGMLTDYRFIGLSLLMVPGLWAWYVWMPNGIRALFEQLSRNGVIVRPKPETLRRFGEDYDFKRFLRRMEWFYNRPWFAIVPVLAVSTYVVLFWSPLIPEIQRLFSEVLPQGVDRDWYDMTPFTGTLRDVLIMVDQYIGGVIVLKVLALVFWLRRLFDEFEVNVRPLHHDGAGGMQPLGDFVIKIGYLIACLGFGLAVTILDNQARAGEVAMNAWRGGPIVGLILYAVLAPVCFFAPLSTAHGLMKEARDRLHREVCERLEAAYEEAVTHLSADHPELSAKVECLDELQKLHGVVSAFPVWPFSVGTVARFFASVVSPLLLPIILTLMQIVAAWMVR